MGLFDEINKDAQKKPVAEVKKPVEGYKPNTKFSSMYPTEKKIRQPHPEDKPSIKADLQPSTPTNKVASFLNSAILGVKKNLAKVESEEVIIKSSNAKFQELEYKTIVKVPVAPIVDKNYYGNTDIINLKGINQQYDGKDGKKITIFDNFNLDIKDVKDRGQFVVILGASGCGKSTLLRYIAGLQKPDTGEVYVNGELKKEQDRIGMVFQQYSSFQWMKVIDNVALPLIMKGVSKKEAREKAMDMIQLVGLDGHENKWAKYPILSGGQLQRVAIARSLMANSDILLLDEPFGALDVKTINQMEDLIIDVWLKMKGDPTIVMVTHSVSQAVYLGDEILILDANPGRVIHKAHVNLPVERNRNTKRDPRFIKMVHELEDVMLTLGE